MGDVGYMLALSGLLMVTYLVMRALTRMHKKRAARLKARKAAMASPREKRRARRQARREDRRRKQESRPAPVHEPALFEDDAPAAEPPLGPTPNRDGFPPISGLGSPKLAPEVPPQPPTPDLGTVPPQPPVLTQTRKPPKLTVVPTPEPSGDALSAPTTRLRDVFVADGSDALEVLGFPSGSPSPIDTPPQSQSFGAFWVQRVFFGTDRNLADEAAHGAVFGSTRGETLMIGTADITLPKAAHRLPGVERPREFALFTVTLSKQGKDRDRQFAVHQTDVLTGDDFRDAASRVSLNAETYAGDALVFLHGFNMGFDHAMFRAAQMAHDLGFDGPVFAYSWASNGTSPDYDGDLHNATQTSDLLDVFLGVIQSVPGVERVHVIAHSMGANALAQLLSGAGVRVGVDTARPIDQLILAAPDLDVQGFAAVAPRFVDAAQNVTLYTCATDRALLTSRAVGEDFERAGDTPKRGPVVVAGVDTVDITTVGTDLLSFNADLYVKNRGLLEDLGQLLQTRTRPPSRRLPVLHEVISEQGIYWRMA